MVTIDAVEGIRIAEEVGAQELQSFVASCAVAIILLLLAVVAAYHGWKLIREKCRGKHPVHLAVAVFFTMVAIVVGGTKPSAPTISFPYTDIEQRYFIDAGSTVNDDYLHLAFTAVSIPMSADFLGYYRPVGSTDDSEWTQFLAGTVGAYITPSDIPFPNAKQYSFQFFSTYTVGPTVHTNGVLNVKWGVPTTPTVGGSVRSIPLQGEVHLDWRIIATPASVYDSPSTTSGDDEQMINILNGDTDNE